MAAPAPASPQEATTSQDKEIKPTANTASTEAVTSTNKPTNPTYLSIKHSPEYALAKSQLASGDMDTCLSLVETAISSLRPSLESADLHEAMAPLFYLYGTTLLYLVEENESMMNGGKPASVPEPEQDSNNPEAEEEVVDPAEDLQIAWENLDIARTILSRLVEPFDRTNIDSTVITLKSDNADTTHSYTKEEQQELLLDLAQIHTRLGDVQRANGNSSSVEDYSRSLEIRRHVLGEYDKLVADNHYYLAQAYGEAPSKEKEREGGALGIVAALGGGGEGEGGTCDGMTKEEIAECLVKSMDHYLACGISFAGYLANMCGEDPEKTTEAKTEGATTAAASLNYGGGGTHSQILETIRKRIANLEPISETDTDKVNDTKEILDEIQEALDTAEGSEDALKAVHAMKESEIRKHSGNGEEEVVGKNGVTTTIGFGTVGATAAAASTATIGFGTCKTDVASAPMMVVKKKKKSSTNDGGTAMKRAKSE